MYKPIPALCVVLLAVMLVAGCSSAPPQNQRRQDGQQGGRGGWQNLTQEQRQEMFGQQEQLMREACQGKTIGDSCTLESPGGQVPGVCNRTIYRLFNQTGQTPREDINIRDNSTTPTQDLLCITGRQG
ncbi:hypothetical protein COY95_02280, partial [Candidatus Woesearchaeota archaeon CG_4_10_14_0_8_um_filter_47_5]